eukprot:COSAG03_NODE_722_length_6101_cov_3031.874209_7_plen_155_part_00
MGEYIAPRTGYTTGSVAPDHPFWTVCTVRNRRAFHSRSACPILMIWLYVIRLYDVYCTVPQFPRKSFDFLMFHRNRLHTVRVRSVRFPGCTREARTVLYTTPGTQAMCSVRTTGSADGACAFSSVLDCLILTLGTMRRSRKKTWSGCNTPAFLR